MALIAESVIRNSMIIRANTTIPKSMAARIGITISAVGIAHRDPPVQRASRSPRHPRSQRPSGALGTHWASRSFRRNWPRWPARPCRCSRPCRSSRSHRRNWCYRTSGSCRRSIELCRFLCVNATRQRSNRSTGHGCELPAGRSKQRLRYCPFRPQFL